MTYRRLGQQSIRHLCLALLTAGCGGDVGSSASNPNGTGGVSLAGTAMSRHTGGSATVGPVTGGAYFLSTGGMYIQPTGGAATQSTACGTAACTPGTCGRLVDACGVAVDCGFTECGASMCGTTRPNTCSICSKLDCATAGNAKCGYISDGCGSLIDCGICSGEGCCGCSGIQHQCGTCQNQMGSCCTPLTCSDYPPGTFGPQSDGCSGALDCGPSPCKKQTCETVCVPGSPIDCSPAPDNVGHEVE